MQAALGILREEGFALHERMTIRTDRGSFHRASYVAVANQHPYTFFGRMPVKAAPRADFEHGLDVVFTRELRRARPVAAAGLRPALAAACAATARAESAISMT